MLLLDYWPLQRFQEIKPDHKVHAEVFKSVISDKQKKKAKKKQSAKESLEVKKPADFEYKWSLIYSLLWEKVPLFALTILSSIVTYFAQQERGAVQSLETLPSVIRIGNALVSYIVYIGKMIWPYNLAIFYPHPEGLIAWQVFGSIFLLIAITVTVFRMVKRSPYLATGWLWYTGTLVPVIGFVQVGAQAMADRYTYIPMIGLFIMIAWGVPDFLKGWNHRKEILLTLSACSILFLSIITWTQVGYWQNSITLFDHTLKVTDNNWLIYTYRGNAYSGLGNYRQAIKDYDRAIEIKPGYANAYNNRGIAYVPLGNSKQAIEDFSKAIEIKPAYADAYNNRGIAYKSLGNYKQAIEDYDRAIEIKPGYPEALNNRGNAYNGLGNYKQAIEDLNRAIEIKPGYTDAYNNRGNAYNGIGNYNQAIEDYDRAIEIKPDYAKAYFNRSVAYIRLGNNNLAINDLRIAATLGNESAKNYLRSQGISW